MTFLRSKGFSDDELIDAGLAHRRPGGWGPTDFYLQRVLIPIRDDQHHVVGLIGRNVGDQHRWAKYKNPPRTAIYDKSVNLYQPLPPPAHRAGQVVVVEGTLDAMAIAVAAIRTGQTDRFCPVTQSGRELSAVQLGRVIDMHPGAPVLGFDGDRAGQDSACRHALAATHQGRRVEVTVLPSDHDPASWLATCGDRGLTAWALSGQEQRLLHPGPHPIPGPAFLANYRGRLGDPSSGAPAVDLAGGGTVTDQQQRITAKSTRGTSMSERPTRPRSAKSSWGHRDGDAPIQDRRRYLTLQQAAEQYPVFSHRFLRRLVQERRIPFSRVGRSVVLAESDIEEYLEKNRVEPPRWNVAS